VTVGELVELLKRMPPQACLVFEDCSEEEFSYDGVEVEFNANGEVVIRTL